METSTVRALHYTLGRETALLMLVADDFALFVSRCRLRVTVPHVVLFLEIFGFSLLGTKSTGGLVMQWVGNEFFCEKRCRVSRAVSRSVVDGAGPKPRGGRPVKSCLTVPDLMRDARADSALLAKFLHAGCTPTRLGVGLNSSCRVSDTCRVALPRNACVKLKFFGRVELADLGFMKNVLGIFLPRLVNFSGWPWKYTDTWGACAFM